MSAMLGNGLKFKKANGALVSLKTHQPVLLIVTAENYAVGKLITVGSNYRLLGLYQRIGGDFVRVKVPLGARQLLVMNPEEIQQFPENYEFHIFTENERSNRGRARHP